MCECDRVGRPVGHWGPCSHIKEQISDRYRNLDRSNYKALNDAKRRSRLHHDPDPDLGEDRDMFYAARGEDW